jgi:putative ABC transport system permease protein
MRAFLSALGIAIGIAAMISVVGISSSSRAELDRQLATLGTNLLTVGPGNTFFGDAAELPNEATSMIARIGSVTKVAATGRVEANVFRNDHVGKAETGGISVRAAELKLPETVGATVHSGAWLNDATSQYPQWCWVRRRRNGWASPRPGKTGRYGWATGGSPWSGSSTRAARARARHLGA